MGWGMFPAKIYVGQIAAVFGIVGVSMWGATQWAAGALGHQPRLGAAWFMLLGYPVYLPWRLFEWWYAYEAYAPEIFEPAGVRASRIVFCSIRPTPKARATIRCLRCARAPPRSVTFRTSLTSWSTRKGRWNAVPIGKRPVIPFS